MPPKRPRRPANRSRAVTAEVLGRRHRNARIPAKWKPHYRELLRLRSRLLQQQGALVHEAALAQPHFSLHMADAGTDSYDRDLALSRISSEQDAVYEIDQALARIQSGTYGNCELTGQAIERRRLEAIPWTRFCAAAEKKLEQEGVIRPARLAPIEPVAEAGDEAEEEGSTLEDRLEEG
jgi:DnaK suppressor protein